MTLEQIEARIMEIEAEEKPLPFALVVLMSPKGLGRVKTRWRKP